MALSPQRTRQFVLLFIAVALGLAVMATVLIVRGWNNEGLQERIQQLDEAPER